MNRQTPTEIRRLLDRHGLRPDKSLGQHLLADPNVVDKIVRLAGIETGDRVVEVGPGTGTLTLALVNAGAQVVAIEVDDRLEPLLSETVGERATIRYEDATDLEWVRSLEPDTKLVANLPYNVGTSLVLDVLRRVPLVTTMVVMMQTEVADRLIASPGDDAYGLPSVVVGLHARPLEKFTVPPQVFFPPPRVGSSVIRLDRKQPSPHAEAAIKLAAVAFQQRRKMLRASLAETVEDISEKLRDVGIDPTARPENIAPGEFVTLAERL